LCIFECELSTDTSILYYVCVTKLDKLSAEMLTLYDVIYNLHTHAYSFT